MMHREASNLADLRVPPHDIAAEQAVLGALMLASDALMQVQDWLQVDAFYTRRHQLIYRAIRELDERKQPCDAVTLSDWFDNAGMSEMVGEMGYLVDLAANTPSAANIVAYAEIVVEHAKRRAAISIGTNLSEGAWAYGRSSAEVIALATDALAKLQQSTVRGGAMPPKKALDEYFQSMMRRYESKSPLIGFATPWNAVSDALLGWQDETAYFLGGRPSMGKSIIGFQAAFGAAQLGQPTVLFSVEMSAKQVMARMIACYGQIPFRWVIKPFDCPDAELYWSRMTAVIGMLNVLPIWIDDTPGLTCDELIARSRRLHKQHGFRFMVTDHMHHMKVDPSRERRHELERIALAQKDLAREFCIPTLTLGQLNRASTQRANKRPGMPDIRESGEIEQIFDVIAMVHREDYYDKNTHLKGIVEWLNVKGRDLDISETIYLSNRFDQQRIENYDGMPPEPPAAQSSSGWGGKKNRGAN